MILDLAGAVQTVQQATSDTTVALTISAAVPALMIMGMWIDSRRHREEERKTNDQRHFENIKAIERVETKINPIWDWWNDRNGR